MSEFAQVCADANRIAAQLRARQPLTRRIALRETNEGRAVRAFATGVPGKGGYLKLRKEALMAQVLAYCHEFFADNDQIPPASFIAERFGVLVQTGGEYLHTLHELGHIERNAVNRWRFTREAA